MDPKPAASPSFASLEHARARQQAVLRWLRPVAYVVVAVVLVAGVVADPPPGLRGARLGVLLGLLGLAVGTLGVVRRSQVSAMRQVPFFALLIAGSGTLIWLQPGGAGFLGIFVAASTAATRLRGRAGGIAVIAALVMLAVASLASHSGAEDIVSSELGPTAFYVLAMFANRLREGQDQAEQLLIQLDETRTAQAQAAVLAERQRVARDMHDVLAHSLSGLVVQLEGARLLASRTNITSELTAAIDRARHLARAGLDEARQAISTLRDDDLPGPDRLAAMAAEFEHDCGVRCELTLTGQQRDLDSQTRLTLYRAAQEALTNVRKHAHPHRVAMRLGYEPTGTRLTVEDFGGDDRPPAAVQGGYGLTGMRERAELLGGSLASGPTGQGFRVELWVPR